MIDFEDVMDSIRTGFQDNGLWAPVIWVLLAVAILVGVIAVPIWGPWFLLVYANKWVKYLAYGGTCGCNRKLRKPNLIEWDPLCDCIRWRDHNDPWLKRD